MFPGFFGFLGFYISFLGLSWCCCFAEKLGIYDFWGWYNTGTRVFGVYVFMLWLRFGFVFGCLFGLLISGLIGWLICFGLVGC